jgi:hypothetical protein
MRLLPLTFENLAIVDEAYNKSKLAEYYAGPRKDQDEWSFQGVKSQNSGDNSPTKMKEI